MDINVQQRLAGLKKFNFFNNIEDVDILKIIHLSFFRTYRKKMTLYYQVDKADMIYFIIRGKIQIIKYRRDDTSMILGYANAGDWIGLPEVLSNGPYLTDAMTSEQSEVLFLHKNI